MIRMTLLRIYGQGCSDKRYLHIYTGLVNTEGVIVGLRKAVLPVWNKQVIKTWFEQLLKCDDTRVDVACCRDLILEPWVMEHATLVQYEEHINFMEDFEMFVEVDARA